MAHDLDIATTAALLFETLRAQTECSREWARVMFDLKVQRAREELELLRLQREAQREMNAQYMAQLERLSEGLRGELGEY